MKEVQIVNFINKLRESDKYIQAIYTNGGCYQFHLVLKGLFPECVPYVSEDFDHVVSFYNGRFYDITGEVSGEIYHKMTTEEIKKAEKWSFHKTMVLAISTCPICDEPLLI